MPKTLNLAEALQILSIVADDDEDDAVQHKHLCEECGFVWNHCADDIYALEAGTFAMQFHTNAHTCPCCKKSESWNWYEGERESLAHWFGQPDFTLSGAPDKTEQAPERRDEVEIYVRNCYAVSL